MAGEMDPRLIKQDLALPISREPTIATPDLDVADPRTDWYVWMDFFRAAAASIVVISHSRDIILADYNGNLLYAPFYAATGFGHSGVVVFFVLSGFWIGRSVLFRLDRPAFWRGYLIDRLSRLLIVLIPALALGGLLDWIGAAYLQLPIYAGTSGSHSIVEPVLAQLTPQALVGNLLFLQTIAVPTWGSNGPLWSLAYEFWFYIWFPALALLIMRRRFSMALASLAVAWFNPAIAGGFALWLIGVALFKLEQTVAARRASLSWPVLAIPVFLATLLLSGVRSNAWMDFALAVIFAALLLALRASQVGFPKFLKPLARFGRESSYSLYVVHFPILALVGSLASGGVRLAPTPSSVALVIGMTLGCVAVAWFFSTLTERNTDKARAKLHQRYG